MFIKTVLLITLISVCHTNGAVLLWSNHKFEISPFKGFTDENFDELLQELGYPDVTLYKTSPALLPEFQQYLKGYYKAYNPNGDINIENATEIYDQDDFAQLEAKQRIDAAQGGNVLSVLVIPSGRSKREETISNITREQTTPKGPVFYKGRSIIDTNVYGLLYSSEPLQLKINKDKNSSTLLLLGKTSADMISVDTIKKDSYTRLNVKIPGQVQVQVHEEDKNMVTLRFIFSWSNGYWSLDSVLMSDSTVTLTTSLKITAPARFSYHCSGETVFSFSNTSHTVELYIHDIQVQINSPDGNFGDAYDCVNFTSGPILSGLFVTAILGIGLIIGLVGLSEIKTMDKFDNQKTKQLVITVSE